MLRIIKAGQVRAQEQIMIEGTVHSSMEQKLRCKLEHSKETYVKFKCSVKMTSYACLLLLRSTVREGGAGQSHRPPCQR